MRALILSAAAGLILAGCATGENGKVTTREDGTRVYGLDDQPETSVAGSGVLMHGVYDSRQLPTGQFTGQERTQDLVGQRPTLPREADARQLDHSPAPTSGAGTLGQSGITGANSVRGTDLADGPVNPQGSAADIYRAPGVGGSPAAETGSGNNVRTNNVTVPSKVGEEQ